MNGDEITLREYIERIIAEHEKRNLERITTLERQIVALESLIDAKQLALALAVSKQEEAYNARFANVNEFRASLDDAVKRGVPREYVDTRLDDIIRRIGKLENDNANRTGQTIGYAAGVSAVMLIITIIGYFLVSGG